MPHIKHRYVVTTFDASNKLKTRTPLPASANRRTAVACGIECWRFYDGNRTVTVTNLTTSELVYDRPLTRPVTRRA